LWVVGAQNSEYLGQLGAHKIAEDLTTKVNLPLVWIVFLGERTL